MSEKFKFHSPELQKAFEENAPKILAVELAAVIVNAVVPPVEVPEKALALEPSPVIPCQA